MHWLAWPRCSANTSIRFRHRCRSAHPARPYQLQLLECQGTRGLAIEWRGPAGLKLFNGLKRRTVHDTLAWARRLGKRHRTPIDQVIARLYSLNRSIAESPRRHDELVVARNEVMAIRVNLQRRSVHRIWPFDSKLIRSSGSCREVAPSDASVRPMSNSTAFSHSTLPVSCSVMCAQSSWPRMTPYRLDGQEPRQSNLFPQTDHVLLSI